MHKYFNDNQFGSMFLDVSKAFYRYCTKDLYEAIAPSFSSYGTNVLFATKTKFVCQVIF